LNLLDWIKILKSQKEKNVKENLEMKKKNLVFEEAV